MLQVRARAEGFARAREHDCPNFLIALDFAANEIQIAQNLRTDGIKALGPVEHQVSDVLFDLQFQRRVFCHSSSPVRSSIHCVSAAHAYSLYRSEARRLGKECVSTCK